MLFVLFVGATKQAVAYYDEAIALYRQALAMDPASLQAHVRLQQVLLKQRNYGALISDLLSQPDLIGLSWTKESARFFAQQYAQGGGPALEREMLNQLLRSESRTGASMAAIALSMNSADLAIEELERCYRAHAVDLMYLKVNPDFDELRGDPRYQDLFAADRPLAFGQRRQHRCLSR